MSNFAKGKYKIHTFGGHYLLPTEETEINKLVYQLYDLTPKQIKIIEES